MKAATHVCFVLAATMGLSLVAAPGALADDTRTAIANVALEYAQSFDGLLAAEPAEADKLGVDRDTLASLKVTGIHKVHVLDTKFLDQDDRRSVEDALVPSDLWWVVLSADRDPRLLVSVQWQTGADAPEAVGLNWDSARSVAAAVAASDDATASLVWIPQDVSVVLSGAPGKRVVRPVASKEVRTSLGLSDLASSMTDYSAALHDRLAKYVNAAAEPGAGGGGRGAAADMQQQGSLPPVGIFAGLVFLAVAGSLSVFPAIRTRRDRR